MIETTYKCDRCGRAIEGQNRSIISVPWGDRSVRSLDVCEDCKESFERWLRRDMQT